MREGGISIWFFIGVSLLVNGILDITGERASRPLLAWILEHYAFAFPSLTASAGCSLPPSLSILSTANGKIPNTFPAIEKLTPRGPGGRIILRAKERITK